MPKTATQSHPTKAQAGTYVQFRCLTQDAYDIEVKSRDPEAVLKMLPPHIDAFRFYDNKALVPKKIGQSDDATFENHSGWYYPGGRILTSAELRASEYRHFLRYGGFDGGAVLTRNGHLRRLEKDDMILPNFTENLMAYIRSKIKNKCDAIEQKRSADEEAAGPCYFMYEHGKWDIGRVEFSERVETNIIPIIGSKPDADALINAIFAKVEILPGTRGGDHHAGYYQNYDVSTSAALAFSRDAPKLQELLRKDREEAAKSSIDPITT